MLQISCGVLCFCMANSYIFRQRERPLQSEAKQVLPAAVKRSCTDKIFKRRHAVTFKVNSEPGRPSCTVCASLQLGKNPLLLGPSVSFSVHFYLTGIESLPFHLQTFDNSIRAYRNSSIERIETSAFQTELKSCYSPSLSFHVVAPQCALTLLCTLSHHRLNSFVWPLTLCHSLLPLGPWLQIFAAVTEMHKNIGIVGQVGTQSWNTLQREGT